MNILAHNACLEAIRQMKAANPEHFAIVSARQPIEIGSAVHNWSRDYLALNEAAAAGGNLNSRARKILDRMGLTPAPAF